jgi:hypothetical protein
MSKTTRLLAPLAAAAAVAAVLAPGQASAAKQGQGSGAAAAGATTVAAARAAHSSDPADWTVSAPATLVNPVGSRVEFTVTVDNPGRPAPGVIVFGMHGLLPSPPSWVAATLDLRTHGRWVALQDEGAAGARYFDTETVRFRHGRTVFRFRIGHPADASPNRIDMRTYADVAGAGATPAAGTTVEVPARTP